MRLLLLPGMDGTGRLFEPLVRDLPSWLGPRVVSYPTTEPLGYAELLPVVRDACADEGSFVVLAASFSGPLAIMLAAEQPAGLRGVVLCASFARCPLRGLPRWAASAAPPSWMRIVPARFVRRSLLGRRGAGEPAALLASALAEVDATVMAARARAVASVDVTAELRAFAAPLLCLAAERDHVVARRAVALIRRIRPDAEVVSIAGPHMLAAVRPIEVAQAVARFVERHGGGPRL